MTAVIINQSGQTEADDRLQFGRVPGVGTLWERAAEAKPQTSIFDSVYSRHVNHAIDAGRLRIAFRKIDGAPLRERIVSHTYSTSRVYLRKDAASGVIRAGLRVK